MENPATDTLPESLDKRVYHDCLGAIRWSPLIRLNKIAKDLECEMWAKCEYFNPGGSVKDRIGKQMILDAEASGRIKPGDTLIEPTSGNTGIGLSLAAAVRGYDMIITLPQKMSQEKVSVLEGLGAKIIRTPTEAAWDSPESHIGVAKKLNQEIPNSHILDQYGNPSNPRAHYENTAEEILQQCDNKVDMVVVSAGTGGTITGIAKKFKERLPECKIVGVDPVGSILAGPGPISSYQVEGIGYDFIPDVLDQSLVDEWVKTEDTEAFLMARRLIREEGMLCGGSSGSTMVGALKAAKGLKKGQRVVVVLSDSVRNYMSKFLDTKWMIDWGHMPAPASAKLGDLAVSDLPLAAPRALPPTASCREAIAFLTNSDAGFVPIVSEEKGLEGVVSADSIIEHLAGNDAATHDDSVTHAYLAEYRQIPATTPLSQLRFVLAKEQVAFVVEQEGPKKALKGVATKRDLLRLLADK